MPVRTRSRTRAEERRIEEIAAKQLLELSLTHPDNITPPVTPMYINRSPPPAPRKKPKKICFGPPSPITRYLIEMRIEMRRSTSKFIKMIDELEKEYTSKKSDVL